MEINNIVEICVALDIAILGIAYPIIVDKISNIGDKYSSQYIAEVFDTEFPQRPIVVSIFKKTYRTSIFKLLLYVVVFSFLPLVLNFRPLFGWNNWFINNSAKLFILFDTIIFTAFFLIWLDKVVAYNGRATKLLARLISKFETSNTELRYYTLKSINELTLYAIVKQDEHLEETLLKFYQKEFREIRRKHEKSIPLVYPIDLYFFVNKLCLELVENRNRRLRAIEHRAVSGVWLLGEQSDHIIISEDTYQWLWRNLFVICDHPEFVKMYWANVSQYFDLRLRSIYSEYGDGPSDIINAQNVEFREEERNRFLEFNYALGGLLLYRQQKKSIKYIFEYTQSQPPSYPLLPNSMTEIFTWFEYFRNEFKHRGTPFEYKYQFPDLDNLGNQRQIIYWICAYLCLLFIRQYSLQVFYVYQQHTAQPQLPENVNELSNWLDSVSYFRQCFDTTLKKQELLNDIGLAELVENNRETFFNYLDELKKSILEKIGKTKLKASLDDDKIELFNNTTDQIISRSFSQYTNVLSKVLDDKREIDLVIPLTGVKTLMSKSAFVRDDIPNVNFDSILAELVSENKIEKIIPGSFLNAATKRYLLNMENIIAGLERVIGSTDCVVVGINLSHDLAVKIKDRFAQNIKLISPTQYYFKNILIVLKQCDLPVIVYENVSETEITTYHLQLINEELRLYTSVIDINSSGNEAVKMEWPQSDLGDDNDFKVQVYIALNAFVKWYKSRDVIQINIASEYQEQGIQNTLNDIEPLED